METIKEAYIKEYPNDELGQEINEGNNFAELLYLLHTEPNRIYDFIGVGDSIVREHCFYMLSKRINRDYDYIYSLWLA